MTVSVAQGLLQDTKQRNFNTHPHPFLLWGAIHVHLNTAALTETLHIPPSC